MSDDTQAIRTALMLIDKGILTPRAGRALTYFTEHGVFCEPLRSPNGDLSIIFLAHVYTPAAFNALWEGRYAPTADDVLTSINALAASPEPDDEPSEPTAEPGEEDPQQPLPSPDAV